MTLIALQLHALRMSLRRTVHITQMIQVPEDVRLTVAGTALVITAHGSVMNISDHAEVAWMSCTHRQRAVVAQLALIVIISVTAAWLDRFSLAIVLTFILCALSGWIRGTRHDCTVRSGLE